MTDIIIHMGLHKTATTTLQQQFFSHFDQINYINKSPKITRFVNAVSKQDPIYFNPSEALGHLEGAIDETRVNLLSRESFSGPPYAGVIEQGLDHRHSIIKNLSAAFPDGKVVLVLRRQDSLARSFYRQYIKFGGTESVERFFGFDDSGVALFSRDRFMFTAYVDALMDHFEGRVLLLLFEDFVAEPTEFFETLADFMGVKNKQIEIHQSNATRFGDTGLEVCRRLNCLFRAQLNPGGIIPGVPVLGANGIKMINPMKWVHDHWPIKGGSKGAITKTSQLILDAAKQDNRQLEQKYKLDLEKHGYY